MPRPLRQPMATFASRAGKFDTERIQVVLLKSDLAILDRARHPPLKDPSGKPGTLSDALRRVVREWGVANPE